MWFINHLKNLEHIPLNKLVKMIELIFIMKFKFIKFEVVRKVVVETIVAKIKPQIKLVSSSFFSKNCKVKQQEIKTLTQTQAKARLESRFIGISKNVNIAEIIAKKIAEIVNEDIKKIKTNLNVFFKFKLDPPKLT